MVSEVNREGISVKDYNNYPSKRKPGEMVSVGMGEDGEKVVVDPINDNRPVDNILPAEKDMGVKDVKRGLTVDLANMPTIPKSAEADEDPMRFPEGEVKERKKPRNVVDSPDRGVKGGLLGRRKRHSEDVDNFPSNTKGTEEEAIENLEREGGRNNYTIKEDGKDGVDNYYESLAEGLDFEEDDDGNSTKDEREVEKENWHEMKGKVGSTGKEGVFEEVEGEDYDDVEKPLIKTQDQEFVDNRKSAKVNRQRHHKVPDKTKFTGYRKVQVERAPKTGQADGSQPRYKNIDRDTIRGGEKPLTSRELQELDDSIESTEGERAEFQSDIKHVHTIDEIKSFPADDNFYWNNQLYSKIDDNVIIPVKKEGEEFVPTGKIERIDNLEQAA